jgi:protein TonB
MKMFIHFFIFILISWNYSYSQASTNPCYYEIDPTTLIKIYLRADTEPTFPGGPEEIINFITKHIVYPSYGEFIGTIYISFIVNDDGSLSNIFVKKKGLSQEIDRASLDLIKKIPNWIPAKCQNENVAHLMIIPISFN